ncbi:hypothetical protein [Acinetobacter dispersus]|uniref:hypothetical protein n=1 Tax=Acinetobacter dispersus TaxID=70348 RepID=UPI001F4AA791|nr:hypothetical protein [Acinetobacter dispersus]MCH7391809.1 hypothetical protein [Acinetobacter dispersus]
MSNRVSTPFPIYNDTDGTPLDAGFIFIGELNKNPISSPIEIFYDSALTMPAENPARTRNGYVAKNGAPRQLFCAEPLISISVQNKRKETVWGPANINLNPGVTTDAVIDTASGKSQAEINADTLKKSANFGDLTNKEQSRDNLDVYSKTQVDDKTKQATETVQGTAKIATEDIAKAFTDDTTIITPKKLKFLLDKYFFGRKWFDVTAERTTGVEYTNNTDQDIDLSIILHLNNTNPTSVFSIEILNPISITTSIASNAQQYSQGKTMFATVPPGARYRVNGDMSSITWLERKKQP